MRKDAGSSSSPCRTHWRTLPETGDERRGRLHARSHCSAVPGMEATGSLNGEARRARTDSNAAFCVMAHSRPSHEQEGEHARPLWVVPPCLRSLDAWTQGSPAASLTEDDIWEWAEARTSKVSPKTVNRVDLTAVKSVYIRALPRVVCEGFSVWPAVASTPNRAREGRVSAS